MDDVSKINHIIVELNNKYPIAEVSPHKQVKRGLHCFYIKINSSQQMILKITNESLMDNSLEQLLTAIQNECYASMEANLNSEVVLFNNLHVEINEPH